MVSVCLFSRISEQVKSMSVKELHLLGLRTSLPNRRLQNDRVLMMFIRTLRDSNLNLLHRYSAFYKLSRPVGRFSWLLRSRMSECQSLYNQYHLNIWEEILKM